MSSLVGKHVRNGKRTEVRETRAMVFAGHAQLKTDGARVLFRHWMKVL